MLRNRKLYAFFLLIPLFFSITSLIVSLPMENRTINVSYIQGLNRDFSNMILEVLTANGSYTAPYEITAMEDGKWASVRLPLPADNYTLNMLAATGNESITPSAYGPDMLEISYFDGLAPDFSNLIIQFTGASGNAETIPYSIVALEKGQWASISLSRAPAAGESVSVLWQALYPGSRQPAPADVNASGDRWKYVEPRPVPPENVSPGNMPIPGVPHGRLVSATFEGRNVEMSSEAYGLLAGPLAANATVRLIVEGDFNPAGWNANATGENATSENATANATGKKPLPGRNLSISAITGDAGIREIKALPGRNLRVLEMSPGSLAAVVKAGATKIYLDTPMDVSLNESIPLIRADLAKSAFGLTGRGTAICLLDTGADYNAAQFYNEEQARSTVISGYDFINSDNDSMDDNGHETSMGHGTFMASVIHAIAPEATIIAVKVLDSSGHGYSSDILSGIDYCRQIAADHNITNDSVRIISMSFGGGSFTGWCDSDPVAVAVQDAYAEGILSVASSGNGGSGSITAPACAMNATAVASTDKSDIISSFSNINGMVDLLAPGEGITAEGLDGPQTASGTSVSAAHVSGAAALLLDANPGMAPYDVRQRFRTTGIFIPYGGPYYQRIDVLNAVMNNVTGIPDNPPVNETNGTVQEYSAEMSSVQRNTLVMTVVSQNVSITSVNTSRAFVLISVRNSSTTYTPGNLLVTANLTNATNIQFDKYTAASTTVEWQVILTPLFSVQRGAFNYSTTNASTNVSITSVNTSNSFIVVMNRLNSTAVAAMPQGFWSAQFTNATNINFTRLVTGSAGNVSWQVVSFDTATVQSGSVNATDGFTNATITEVNLSRSFLIFSRRANSTYSIWYEAQGRFMNSTAVGFKRLGTGTANITTLEYFVVTSPNLRVESGNATLATVASKTVTITSVNTTTTMFLGSCDFNTASANPGHSSVAQNLTTATTAYFAKGSAVGTSNCTWFSVSITSCPLISVSGTTTLQKSLLGAPHTANPLSGQACVLIAASNVIFDCAGFYITNNGTADDTYGILLNGSLTNVTVRNCRNVTGYAYGIYVNTTNRSFFTNNTAYGNTQQGFYFGSSSSNILTNNSAYNNQAQGFYLESSSYNNLTNNIAYNNSKGFYLYLSSNNNNITNNSAYNNTYYGFVIHISSYNNLTNNTAYTNYDNGFQVYSSSYNNLTNNIAYNNTWNGFQIYDSSNNTLTRNTAYNNTWDGFGVDSNSNNNTLFNNTAYNNLWIGFYLSSSSNNILSNNTAYANSYAGFQSYSDSNNTISNNSAYINGNDGFMLHSVNNNTLINNSAYANLQQGFYVFNSFNNTLANNTAYNNTQYGFFLSTNSNNNTLANNTAYNNTQYGFILYTNSNNNTLTNNIAYNNTQHGFYLFTSSNNNILTNNTAYNNAPTGFSLTSSSNNNILTNNTAYNNTWDGFSLDSSSNNNTLTNNTAYNNTWVGFELTYSSSNNTLSNNTAYANLYTGFQLYSDSNNNTLTNNSAYNNSFHGFMLHSISNNTLINNSAYANLQQGFYVFNSSNNTLTNNTAYTNYNNGFQLYYSSNNTLTNNTAYNNSVYQILLSFSSNGNRIYNNIFNASSGLAVVSNIGTNYWNTTRTVRTNIIGGANIGGNFYSDYGGYTYDGTGIGASIYLAGNSTDYLPLTNRAGSAPSVTSLSLNATSPQNLSTDNITCNYALGGSVTHVAVSWLRNSVPLMAIYLPFDGKNSSVDNTLLDYSGYRNNATVLSAPVWNPSGGYNLTAAYMFDGIDDYISVPNYTTLNLTGSITLVARVMRNDRLNDNHTQVISRNGSYVMFISDNQSRVYCGNSTAWVRTKEAPIIPGRWQTIACVFNGSNISIFIDSGGTPSYPSLPIYAIGDSITAQHPLDWHTTGSPEGFDGGNVDLLKASYEYWLDYYARTYVGSESMNKTPLVQGGYEPFHYNKGASGAVCDDFLGATAHMHDYDVYGMDVPNGSVVISMCGVNDIGGGDPASEVELDLKTLYNRSVNKSDHIIMMTITPFASTPAVCANIKEVNDWLKNFTTNESIPFVNTWTPLVGPDNCSLNPSYTSDTLHPNVAGSRLIAKAIWSAVFSNQSWNDTAVQQATENVSWTGLNTTNNNATFIGALSNGSYPLNASVNYIQIYPRALSQQELGRIFNDSPVIVSEELQVGEMWQCMVTPLSAQLTGPTNSSNNLTILANITNCPVITTAGTTTMTANYTGAPNSALPSVGGNACVKIASSNVIFDCNGFSITHDSTPTNTHGILLNGSLTNVTVKNCPGISGYQYGIYVYQSNNSNFTNNTAYNNTNYGFYLENSSYNNLTNNSAYNNTQYGFYLYSSSDNNTLTNNSAYNNSLRGFSVAASTGINFTSNSAYNNNYNFFIDISSNITLTNNTACNSSYDGFWLSLTSGSVLANNTAYNNSRNGFFILSGSSNNTLSGNSARNNTNGFELWSSSSILTNNTAYNNTNYGFYLENSSYNNLTNNSAYNNTQYGFYLYSSSDNNTLTNNSAYNNSLRGFSVAASTGINFTSNSAYNNNYNFFIDISSNITLTNNTACNSSYNGFWLSLTSGSVLANNTAYNNPENGFFILSGSSNNTLSGNSAYNNTDGFELWSSSGAILTNNSAYNNTASGFVVNASSDNNLTNNSAYNNTQYGFHLTSSSNNNSFSSNIVFKNLLGGTHIENSTLARLTSEHFYNNSRDFRINANSTAISANLSTAIFDNPAGNFSQFTNLSLNDTVEANLGYFINWTTNTSALPSGYNSFAGKFINITANNTTGVSIDSLVWTWTDAEAGAYDESKFGLWMYNASGWIQLNASPNTASNTLSLSTLTASGVIGILQQSVNVSFTSPTPPNNTNNFTYPITFNMTATTMINDTSYIEIDGTNQTCTRAPDNLSCAYTLPYASHIFNHTYSAKGYANISGSYAVTNESNRSVPYYGCGNVSANGTMLNNVSINGSTCFTITANNVNFSGQGYTVTGNSTASTYGIFMAARTGGNFSNFRITGFEEGFYLKTTSTNNILSNNTLYNNTNIGIYLEYSSSSNVLINNRVYNTPYGIDLYSSSNNNLTNNTVYLITQSGFYLDTSSNGNILANNTAYNASMGFYILTSSSNNNLTNNTVYNTTYGFYLGSSSSNNTLANNTAYSNTQDGFVFDTSYNNTFTNNSAHDNSRYGFYIYSSSGNTLANNTANSNLAYGFIIHTGSDNNNLTNNTAYNNSISGFLLVSSSGNNLTRNTAWNNTQYGFYLVSSSNNNSFSSNNISMNLLGGTHIQNSTLTRLASEHFYNNSRDFRTNSTGSTATIFNLSTAIFDNPAGNFSQMTNISINDSVEADLGYFINWTTNTSILPAGYASFAGKFINITANNTTGVSIDSLVWTWTDAEVSTGGYAESLFSLWMYNASGWVALNSSPDTSGNTLSLSALTASGIIGILQSPPNCPVITSSGTTTMTNNFTGAPNDASPLLDTACVKIATSNVIFDCMGFYITNNGTTDTTIGILLNGSLTNVTVKNCRNVSGYSYGIYVYQSNSSNFTNNSACNNSYSGFRLYSSSNNTITNNSVYNTQDAFYLSSSSNNNLTNNSAYSNFNQGFFLDSGSNSSLFNNNSAYDNAASGFVFDSASNNTLANNRAYNNSQEGFYFTSSSNNNITNNSAYNNSQYGFRLFSSSNNNTFTNNTAYNNSRYGFYISLNSNNNSLSRNNIFKNLWGGTHTENSTWAMFRSEHFYNNSRDFRVNSTGSTATIFNLSTVIFDNPAGDFQNFTNLSINDSVEANLGYFINWTTNKSTLPPNYNSFAGKFVNITANNTTGVSIDSLVWTWTDAEAGAYNESRFSLWTYNDSGWVALNSSPNTTTNTLSLSAMTASGIIGILQAPFNCPVITSAGTTTMTANFTGAPNNASPLTGSVCVKIAASDVIFDCNGFSITHNASPTNTYGIQLNGSLTNVTVKNCPGVSGYEDGIYVNASNNSNFTNSSAHNNSWNGFYFDTSSSNNLINSTAYNNTGSGFYLYSSFNNTLANSTAYNNTRNGFQIYSGSDNNTLTNNTARNNTNSGFYIYASSNNTFTNNSAYGNIYGFDLESGSSNNNITNSTAYRNSQYGFYISGSNSNAVSNDSGYLNYRGFYLDVSSASNNITNNSAYNNTQTGIAISGGSSNRLSGNLAYWNTNGFYLDTGSNNIFANNSVYNNSDSGFYLTTSCTNNNFTNNSVRNNANYGFYLLTHTNSIFTNNSAYLNSKYGFYLESRSNNNSISASNIFRNLLGGLYILNSTLTNVSAGHFYNNSRDFKINSTSGSSMPANLSLAIFDNPAGNFQNFTNLSINDSVEPGTSYSLNWSSNTSAPPGNYVSFAGKFINLTNLTPNVSIDTLVWTWTDAEVSTGGYDESLFSLWTYNASGWVALNSSPNTTTNTLSLSALTASGIIGILQSNVTNCPVITSAGTTTMPNNYTGAPNDASPLSGTACVKIAASDVVFDCAGFYITNNGTADDTYGILLNGSLTNVTVRNCRNVTGYAYGISVYQSNNTVIANNSACNNSIDGFSVSNSNSSALANNSAHDNLWYGFFLEYNFNNNFTNNSAHDNSYGFYLSYSSNNTMANNSAYNNSFDGIQLLFSSNNTLTNNSAYNSTYDGFYLWSSSNNTLTINFAYDNGNSGFVFASNSDNNNITNNTARNNTWNGFYLTPGSNNNLTNNTAYNNSQSGFYLESSSNYNNLTNNFAYNNTQHGFWLSSSSSNNLTNNSAWNNSQSGFYLESSSNNNNLTSNSAYNNSLGFNLVSSSSNVLNKNSAYRNVECGFYLLSSPDNNLTSNTAYNNTGEGVQSYSNSGFAIDTDSSGNRLINNSAYNHTWTGFYIFTSPDTTIANTSSYNNLYGFYITSSENSNIINNSAYKNEVGFDAIWGTSNNNITGNLIYNNSAYGFALYTDSNNNVFTSNTVANSTVAFYITTNNNTFSNNTARDNNQSGFYLDGGLDNAFINNSAYNNTESGFRIAYNSNNNLTRNIAYDNTYGFFLDSSSNNNLTNNSAWNNSNSGFDISYSSISNTLANNSAYTNTYGFFFDPGADNNTLASNIAYENNIYGFGLVTSSNNNLTNNSAHDNSYGFYLEERSDNNTFTSNLAFLNTYGVYSVNSTLNNFTSNNITNNTNLGMRLDSASNNTKLASNRVCYNSVLDVQNLGVQNNGTLDACDSFAGWNEGGHLGCEFACTSMWQRIYGNVNRTIFIGHNDSAPYVYSWDGSAFNIYVADYDSAIHWSQLQAIGRNTSNQNSTNDFTELDVAFNTTSFGDNINRTYSLDNSTPKQTANYTVFGRAINFVPVANSTATNTSFRTGILWDMAGGGTEYDNAHNQTTVWVVKANASATDVYGIYDYLSQVPYTLGNYTGSNNMVTVYVELK